MTNSTTTAKHIGINLQLAELPPSLESCINTFISFLIIPTSPPGPAATPCHTTLPCDSDPTHIMPVTRSSARKSSKRRIGFAVGENDGQKEDVAGEDKVRENLFSPSKTPGAKSRGRLPLRPQNTKVAGGREGGGGRGEEESGVTPTKVRVRK